MDDPQSRAQSDPPEGSELDAEGEEVDEEFEQTLANGFITQDDIEIAEDGLPEPKEADDVSDDEDISSVSSVSEENEWQGSSHSEEDAESKIVDTNNCMFCGQDEVHDPSEEFEEYLECVVCGNNAHRQCARDEDALDSDEDTSVWRCKACVESGALPDPNAEPKPSSMPQGLLVDLGDKQAESHTEFESALDDDPLDARSLRKRKASDTDPSHRLRKRWRPSESITASADPDRSPSPPADGDVDSEQPGRPLRLRRRKSEKPLVHTVSAIGASLILSFNLDRERMQKIIASKQKKNRNAIKPKKKAPPLIIEDEPPHYPPLPSSQLFPYFERDETKKHYGGILSEGEADNLKTIPGLADRERFEASRQKAEDDWKKKMTDTDNIPEPTKPSQKMSGPPSKIKCINFGGYEIDTWNTAPYPEEYSRNKIIYICEFCLKYMNSDFVAWRHKLKCEAQYPPGDEIYRDGKYSFFEVDGRKHPVYCQNLCLLAKLFLGSKTLYYDVEPFLFYIMTENDEFGCHFVGYFSKEKRSSSQNNVSCILVMPIYQRRGFGHMLIEFSYLLTKAEQKTGSPEKPLSDMGLVSYRGYWRLMMCYQLVNEKGSLSISELSRRTGMTPDDVVSALEGLRALVRDPITKTYALRLDYEYFKEYIDKYEKKNYPRINPDALVWVPFVAHHGMNMQFEGGQVHAVAPREDGSEGDAEGGAETQQSGDGGKATEGSEMETDTPMTNGAAKRDKNGVNGTANGVSNGDAEEAPSTPVPNGEATITQLLNTVWGEPHPGLGIPPTRFEVFPPVPGLTVKRKPGRPFGSTKKRPGTPRSNGSATKPIAAGGTGATAVHTGSPMARRSRAVTDAESSSNGAGPNGGGPVQDGRAAHKVKDEAEMQLQAQQGGGQEVEMRDAGEDTDADAEGEDE